MSFSSSTPGSHPKFRVAICGGGPGGLTLAVALSKFNSSISPLSIVLYESQPEVATVGAMISVWPRTQTILRGLGIMDALKGELGSDGCDGDTGFTFRKSDGPDGLPRSTRPLSTDFSSMSDKAAIKKKLAACECKIAELEEEKRQMGLQIRSLRMQSEQRAQALRGVVGRFGPVNHDIDMGEPAGVQVLRANEDVNEGEVNNVVPNDGNMPNEVAQREVSGDSCQVRERTIYENKDMEDTTRYFNLSNEAVLPFDCATYTKILKSKAIFNGISEDELQGALGRGMVDKDDLQPFDLSNEVVLPFDCAVYANVLKSMAVFNGISEDELQGASGFSYDPLRSAWTRPKLDTH